IVFDIAQTGSAEVSRNELGNFIKFNADARIAEVEIVIKTRQHADVDIKPLNGFFGVIVDGVVAAQSSGRCSRPLEFRGAAVDGELRCTVQNHEHFFHLVVEVRTDATTGKNLT